MKECPKCRVSYPAIHFRLHNDPVDTCRACRNRAAAKANCRKKRALIAQMGALNGTANRRKATSATQLAKRRFKRARERFNQLTGHTRRRVRDLGNKVNPRPRTERALVAREALLGKYYAAYMKQRVLIEAGFQPLDIMEYM